MLLVSSQIQTAVFERDVKFATELTALQTHLSNNLKTVAETQLVNAPRLLRTPRLQPVWQLFDSASSPRDLRETSALRWKPLRRCLKPRTGRPSPSPSRPACQGLRPAIRPGCPRSGLWGAGPFGAPGTRRYAVCARHSYGTAALGPAAGSACHARLPLPKSTKSTKYWGVNDRAKYQIAIVVGALDCLVIEPEHTKSDCMLDKGRGQSGLQHL